MHYWCYWLDSNNLFADFPTLDKKYIKCAITFPQATQKFVGTTARLLSYSPIPDCSYRNSRPVWVYCCVLSSGKADWLLLHQVPHPPPQTGVGKEGIQRPLLAENHIARFYSPLSYKRGSAVRWRALYYVYTVTPKTIHKLWIYRLKL